MNSDLPIAVIGAGPVGLAAAAHLVRRGLTPLVLERGPSAADAVRAWAHVRVFSPWSYNVDSAARDLLADTGWTPPDADYLPTGAELLRDYLDPLAAHPEIAPHIVCGAEVVAIAREGFGKITNGARDAAPFLIRWRAADGAGHEVRARAVIDASGTWHQPNPLGTDGLPVPGETKAAGRIAYGIPDVLGRDRAAYADSRVLVAGSGHSAMNVVLDLLRLQNEAPDTHMLWALRHDRLERILGGGANDQLPGRGALGLAARKAVDEKRLTLLAPLAVRRVARDGDSLSLSVRHGSSDREIIVDRIVVATGFRPDHSISRELRVVVDPVVEAPPALAPLIDPNLHSCGTVPPHGAAELAHPEPGFYIVGMKSYGRAPTFLMATGYEQVRSVVAEIAGDHEAARRVELVLPETGVCNAAPVSGEGSTCCGGPPPAERKNDSCCAADAAAKDVGKSGCGCGSRPTAVSAPLPNVVPTAFQQPHPERLAVPLSTHRPRILMLYGSLRERSYSRFLTFEAARLLEAFGAEVEIFDPAGLPLPDATSADHPKVQELRALSEWSEGHVWTSPERHGSLSAIIKTQIDWIPLSVGSVRPTQGRTLAVMQVSGGSQSFNAVNQMRVLGRWMRMITIPNQSSVAKAFQEFDEDGRMKPSSYYDRVVDVMEELVKFTLLTRDASGYLTNRYSERKEDAAKLEARVSLGSI